MLSYHPNHLFSQLTSKEEASLREAYASVQTAKKAGKLPFALLPGDTKERQAVTNLAQKLKGKFEQVIVVGIGGSDLGARAAFRALCSPYWNVDARVRNGMPQLFFAGDTTDPEALVQLCDIIDWSRALVIVISKSGNTIEQMSTFLHLRQCLISALGEDRSREHIVTVTGTEGTLREITDQEKYDNLVHGPVGGRFSILSAVGLFPLALVGIDIEAMAAGAAELDATETELPSVPAHYALHQYHAYQTGQHISVMFPYVYGLREFGFWFRQLWAESLGKKTDLVGKEVHVGPTPIAAVGPTDQHSQAQLYMEGPNDKIMTFIRCANTARDITLPAAFPHQEGAAYLEGISMQRILTAEQEATAEALAQQNRPSVLIELPVLDAYHLGQLFYFFELATAYAGALFNINTFDQPGVELGKQLMYKALGRPGF